MARARNIKPGFYKNEDLAECSVWARFIFPGLWMLADRDGLLEDRPKRIKGELLPFDPQEVEPLLAELERHKLIIRYKNSDGAFICIPKFKAHQSPHYSEKPSGIKPPDYQEQAESDEPASGGNSGNTPGALPENDSIKRGSQPPESLLLNPEPRIPKATPSGVGEGASAPPAKRKAQLPTDFGLTPERRAALLAANPTANPPNEFAQFCDHHRSRGNAMLDWDAAWRTWCRNSKNFSRGPANGKSTQSPLERIQEAYRREFG
jgi:hypothetical protein